VLGGRDVALGCEELSCGRCNIDAGRLREAALQLGIVARRSVPSTASS